MECLKHSPPCGDLMGGYVVKEDTTGARQAPPIIMIRKEMVTIFG